MSDVPADSLRSRIAAFVVSQIMAGEWQAGDRIMSESQLAERFGASRMTVHHALRELTTRGVLTRRSGSGTFVATPRSYVAEYAHVDVIAEIEARGNVHHAEVLVREIRPACERDAGLFDVAPGTPLFHALVVHHENGQAIELEDRLIDPQAMPDCMAIDLTRQTLFSRLMLMRPYREGSESLRAVLPTPEQQALLEITPNTPCLQIVRRTWSIEGVVTHAQILRAGDHAIVNGTVSAVR